MPRLFRVMPVDRRSANLNRAIALNLLLVSLLVSTGACVNRNRAADRLTQDTKEIQKFDSNLTFNDVTLEQADEQGKLWWKVKAKQASYSKDQKNAAIQNPKGELYQDGKAVFKVEAQKGEVQQDGKSIILKGQIIATDIRDGTILKGNEAEWRPIEDLLIVRDRVSGTHKQMQFVAQEGRFMTRAQTMELSKQIVASSKSPEIQLKTEHLIWNIKQQKVVGDRPLQIDRYQSKVLTEQSTADKADVDLKAKVVNLQQNAKITLKEKGVQISSNALTWNLNLQAIDSSTPITIVNAPEQVTLTANKGQLDLQKNTVDLIGSVRGNGQRNQANLVADRVVWFLNTQQFDAQGNVNYRQESPPFSIVGPRAYGKLQDQQVAVNGGNTGGRVEIQIVPQPRP